MLSSVPLGFFPKKKCTSLFFGRKRYRHITPESVPALNFEKSVPQNYQPVTCLLPSSNWPGQTTPPAIRPSINTQSLFCLFLSPLPPPGLYPRCCPVHLLRRLFCISWQSGVRKNRCRGR